MIITGHKGACTANLERFELLLEMVCRHTLKFPFWCSSMQDNILIQRDPWEFSKYQ